MIIKGSSLTDLTFDSRLLSLLSVPAETMGKSPELLRLLTWFHFHFSVDVLTAEPSFETSRVLFFLRI